MLVRRKIEEFSSRRRKGQLRMAPIRIGEIVAERGTVKRGFLQVGETPTGPVHLPVVLISGASPGPTLCLTAGVHAGEYPGIDAVARLTRLLDPAELSGTIIAVTVANPPMFQARSGFVSPIDGLNLNRTFPGNPGGTFSEVLADVLLNKVVVRADYHIDCHGGDLPEILYPYAGFSLTGDPKLDAQGEALARLYSPRIIALYRDTTPLPPTNGSLTHTATRRGIVSVLAECGSAGTLHPADVRIHMDGLRNVMRFLRMIPGEPEVVENQLRAVGQFVVGARRGGLVHLKPDIGDAVKEGQEIAEICDVFGDVIERVHAPAEGIVRIIWTHKVVNTGDPLVKCWRVEPATSFPFESVRRQIVRRRKGEEVRS